ncbi:MAG TPA: hypothetical protein VJA47_04525 [archaeon]|nr:hypothetical protein [archaeon]
MVESQQSDPLEDFMWEVRLEMRKELCGIKGNSSLALLGPELVDAVSEYGLRVPYRGRGQYHL